MPGHLHLFKFRELQNTIRTFIRTLEELDMLEVMNPINKNILKF